MCDRCNGTGREVIARIARAGGNNEIVYGQCQKCKGTGK